jgi:hypothetical protein
LRCGAIGRGKSGGARVIHYFADDRFPVFLVDVFANGDMENYSGAGLAAIRVIAKALIEHYARRTK